MDQQNAIEEGIQASDEAPFSLQSNSPRLNGSTPRLGGPNCPICSGTGYWRQDLPLGHPEFGKIHVCSCNVPLRDGHVAHSGLDEQERSLRLSAILTDPFPGHARMLDALQDFVARPCGMLTIYGGPGNGKTFAVKAAVNQMIEHGQEAIYIRGPDLVTCMRQALYPSGDVKSDLAYQRLKRIEAAPVLVLDDFDRVHESRGTHEQVDALIERRCDLGMRDGSGTILVMNSDPGEQPDWLRSRLFDGRNRVVHNDDPDLRPSMKRKAS